MNIKISYVFSKSCDREIENLKIDTFGSLHPLFSYQLSEHAFGEGILGFLLFSKGQGMFLKRMTAE